jgi:hypothetical protein
MMMPDMTNKTLSQNKFTCLWLWVAILLGMNPITACESFQPYNDEHVIARVGNQVLTIQDAMGSIPEGVLQQDTLKAIAQYQNHWIEQKILESEAQRLGIDRNPEVIRKIERLKSQILTQSVTEAVMSMHRDELEVSREEAQNYFQQNRERFRLDERHVRFRHVIARSRVDADNARQALLNGIEWDQVAERYSVNPDRQLRQSEQFIPLSMALNDIPAMNRFLNVIGRTEISPVRAHGGYFHFVQLMEDQPEGSQPDLDWLIDQITEWLYMDKSQRLINSYKRNLYLQAEANNEIVRQDVEQLNQEIISNALQH